ncbi:hypothetical protein SUGI_0675470 [Cryptomeria japonica]|nr:hypothetical protein SUGI_0675470 [Cryptomeria japonica]
MHIALLHICVYVRKLEWQDAFAILLELASRNLLNLPAILETPQKSLMEMLPSSTFLSTIEMGVAEVWAIAQFVSIYTGSMDNSGWYESNFSETEVQFKKGHDGGSGCLIFTTPTRNVRLERLVTPDLQKQRNALHNLEKLSLSLCEGFGSASTFDCTKLQEFNVDHCSGLD